MASSSVINGADATFEQDVLNESSRAVLVDFWAPWCGPCKAVAPMLDDLADSRPGLKIVKINVEEHKEIAAQLGVRSIPTMALYHGGQLLAKKTGAGPRSQLDAWIQEHAGAQWNQGM